jgi:hypothetical protein
MQVVGHTVMISISLDGKLQVVIIVETSKGKWPFFVIPAIFINRYIGSLAGCKYVSIGLFYFKAFYIVRYLVYVQNLYNMVHMN